jgi:kinesin family protein C1
MEQAGAGRAVSRTNMNERSSRSHCVFGLKIIGQNTRTGQVTNGVLNLIDLAGESLEICIERVTGQSSTESTE